LNIPTGGLLPTSVALQRNQSLISARTARWYAESVLVDRALLHPGKLSLLMRVVSTAKMCSNLIASNI
jgi:hypothetical protein